MSESIETVSDLVDAFGGTSKFAEWLDVVPSAISNWKESGRIPSGWHLQIYLECEKRRLRVSPKVFGMEGEPKSRPNKRAEARAA